MADEKPEEKKEDKPAEDTKPAAATELAGSDAPADADSDDEVEKAPADPNKPTMDVKVYAPFKIYFTGDAYSITAVNETGPFDILPHHHNFLCMLVPCELIIRTPFEEKKIKISRALLHVKAEKVTVFVDV